jgi:hypothetical protein
MSYAVTNLTEEHPPAPHDTADRPRRRADPQIDEALVTAAMAGFDLEPWISFAAKMPELTDADIDAITAAGAADPTQAHAAKLWFRAQCALMKAAGGRGNADSTRFRQHIQAVSFSGPAGTPGTAKDVLHGGVYVYQAGMAFASKHLIGQKRYTQAHYDLLARPWVTVFGTPGE